MHVKHISGFIIETADLAIGSEEISVTLEGAEGYDEDLIRISSEQGEVVYSLDVLEYIVKVASRIRFVEDYIPALDDQD